MLRNFDLGKDGSGWSVQDLFEIAMEESKQNLATFKAEHIGAKKTAAIRSLHLMPLQGEILKELNKLSHEIQPEIYAKIELLIQAVFIAGSDTESYCLSNFIGAMRTQKRSLWIDSHKAGKKEKRNPVLVRAIKEIINPKPDASFKEVKTKMKKNAENGVLNVDGYDILYIKKGETYKGEKLKTGHLVFEPLDTAKHGNLSKRSMESLRRYFDNIKKRKW